MKIKVEVECTPDEARQFLGLPDVKPFQTIAMTQLEKQLAEATSFLSPEALVKTWLSFVPQSPEQIRDMVASVFRSPLSGLSHSDSPHAATAPKASAAESKGPD